MVQRTALSELDDAPHADVFDDQSPRGVRLELDEGESIPEHRHPDSAIVFHQIAGRVDVTVGDETLALEPGDVARFDGDQDISPTARTDTTALIVFVPKDGL
jgi:quercetin dioxygenase-like cupin family protein